MRDVPKSWSLLSINMRSPGRMKMEKGRSLVAPILIETHSMYQMV